MADKKTSKKSDINQTEQIQTTDSSKIIVSKQEVKTKKSQTLSSAISNQTDIKQDIIFSSTTTAPVSASPDWSTTGEKVWFFSQIRDTSKQIALKQYDKIKELIKAKSQEIMNQAKDKFSQKANEMTDKATEKSEEAKDSVLKKFKWLV